MKLNFLFIVRDFCSARAVAYGRREWRRGECYSSFDTQARPQPAKEKGTRAGADAMGAGIQGDDWL